MKAIAEVEDCIHIKEKIATQVRLTAIGVYALQLSEWGHYQRAYEVASSAFEYKLEFDPNDITTRHLIE